MLILLSNIEILEMGEGGGGRIVSSEYHILWKPNLTSIIKVWYPPNTTNNVMDAMPHACNLLSIMVYIISFRLRFIFLQLCSHTFTFVCEFNVWSSRSLNTKYNFNVVHELQILTTFPTSPTIHLDYAYFKTQIGN
jgi:hypothetical protein